MKGFRVAVEVLSLEICSITQIGYVSPVSVMLCGWNLCTVGFSFFLG